VVRSARGLREATRIDMRGSGYDMAICRRLGRMAAPWKRVAGQ
jgi:hypothetical protein